MADNPIRYEDLFNFEDDGAIKKAISNINKLKKSYTDFFDTVINGQIGRLSEQLAALSVENEKLVASTRDLSVAQKANQKTLLDNLKVAESNATAARKIKSAQDDVARANKTVGDGVKTLQQQYAALKKEYDKAFQQGDTAKLISTRQQLKELGVQILQLNAGLKTSTQAFKGAAGSYDELNNKTKALLVTLRAMPGGLSATSKEAEALKNQIYQNTQRLKDFDKEVNQNFRNVGNYGSALNGLSGQIESLALSYVSITGLIALVGKIITNNAELSDSLSDVRRTAGLTADEAERLVKSLEKIDTRTSLKGLLDIAVIGGQLGIAKDDLAGFTKVIDELSVVLKNEIPGGADAVATALGKINGIFNVQKKEGTDTETSLRKTGAAILLLGQAGLATGEFLQDFTLRVAGVSQAAKISLPTALAYGATLEQLGATAEVAGGTFNRLIGNLASKRQEFFTIAKIADSTLTLQKFTDLINTDASAALRKFFAGLNAGGSKFTEYNDLLLKTGLKSAATKAAVESLAASQDKLTENINNGIKGYENYGIVADQFKIKNDNLASSVDKLSKSFAIATSGGRVQAFFKGIIDGITGAITAFDKLVESKSWKEFFFRLAAQGAALTNNKAANIFETALGDIQADVDKRAANTPRQNRVNDAVADFRTLKQPAQVDAIKTQTTLRDLAFDVAGPNATREQITEYNDEQTVLRALQAEYKKLHGDKMQAIIDGQGETTETLKTTAAIRAKIKEFQNDILNNPQNKDADLKQIVALKAQLKELSGVTATAKTGFQLLQDKLKELEDKLANSIISGKIKANDFDNPLARKVNAARVALSNFKKAYEDVLRGPNIMTPVNDALPGKSPIVNPNELAKSQNALDAQAQVDNLDIIALDYAKYNNKILTLYRSGTISKLELDKSLLDSSIVNENLVYGSKKRSLELQLANEKAGSKQSIQISNQIAALDEQHNKDAIQNAQRQEDVRIQSIRTVFDYFRSASKELSSQLGDGLGNVFSVLTTDLQKFFENGKDGFKDFGAKFAGIAELTGAAAGAATDIYKASSEARIAALEKEREREITLAGDNAKAKTAINKRFDKEVAAEKTKQAKADKLNALFQIAIATAIAVVKALPNYPLAIAIGVLGAIELALVAAKPIPKFEKGTDNAPGGLSIVGEKGPEFIDQNGRISLSPGVPTLMNLEKGSKVKTAKETAAMFDYAKLMNTQFGNDYLDSMIDGTTGVRRASNLSTAQILTAINAGHITEAQIARAMGKALSNKPEQRLVLDEYGFNIYNIDRNLKAKMQGERMKMGGNG